MSGVEVSAWSRPGRIGHGTGPERSESEAGGGTGLEESEQVKAVQAATDGSGGAAALIGLNDPCVRPCPSGLVQPGPFLPGEPGDPSTPVHAVPAPSGRIVVASARDRLARAADRALARHPARRALWQEAGHNTRRWRELAEGRAR